MKVSPKTIFRYQTVYFDLDFTTWQGCAPDFWAKKLDWSTAYKQNNRIYDENGLYIEAYLGIHGILERLKNKNIRINAITRGGVENLKREDQPAYKALKMFGLAKYFSEIIILDYWVNKSSSMTKQGTTVLIDDMDRDLEDVLTSNKGIDIIDRREFDTWTALLD